MINKKTDMSWYADQVVSGRLHPISSALDLEGLQLSVAIPNFTTRHINQKNPHHTQTSWRVNLCNLRTAWSGYKLVQYVVATLCGILNIMCTQITLPKWWVNSASKVHHRTLVTRHLRHDPPIVVRWIWWRWDHLRVMLCCTVDQCSKGRRIGPSCVTLRSWRDFCGKETRSVGKSRK